LGESQKHWGRTNILNEFLELCGDFQFFYKLFFWGESQKRVGEESDIPWNIE
jgi:hypothetical protein